MAWVYILECSDGSYYTGSTVELERRLWEHNEGDEGVGANYPRKRRPVNLVFAEEYERVDAAFEREKQVQGWSRSKKLALVQGRFDVLPALSRGRSNTTPEGNAAP